MKEKSNSNVELKIPKDLNKQELEKVKHLKALIQSLKKQKHDKNEQRAIEPFGILFLFNSRKYLLGL